MRLLFFVALIVFQSALLTAQRGQPFQMPSFKGIDLQTHADVYLSYGAVQKVIIEGSSEWTQSISKTVNSRGVWNINAKTKSGEVGRIYIVTPSIQHITLSGSGSITCENRLDLHRLMPLQPLEVELSGEGSIALDVDARKVVAHLSGTGNIDLMGKVGVLNSTLSGTGDFRAYPLIANSTKVVLSGTGNVEVQAREWFNATLSGTGNILYRGNPTFNVTQVTGQGNITQRG